MKVILKEDIVSLGVAGDVVNVADGYARNYLLPKKLAVLATDGNLKELEFKKETLLKEEKKKRERALRLASELEGKTLTITARTGEEGHLYGSVTHQDVAEVIEKQLKKTIDRKKIVLPGSIKETGTYQILIKIYPEVKAKINLEVSSQEGQGQESGVKGQESGVKGQESGVKGQEEKESLEDQEGQESQEKQESPKSQEEEDQKKLKEKEETGKEAKEEAGEGS